MKVVVERSFPTDSWNPLQFTAICCIREVIVEYWAMNLIFFILQMGNNGKYKNNWICCSYNVHHAHGGNRYLRTKYFIEWVHYYICKTRPWFGVFNLLFNSKKRYQEYQNKKIFIFPFTNRHFDGNGKFMLY